jgi:hypothetical protein
MTETPEVTGTPLEEGTLDEMREQVQALIEANMEREQKMLAQFNAQLDPMNFFHVRLSALVQVLLDEPGQLKLEVLTQTLIANMLDMTMQQAETEATRRKLLEGVPGYAQPQPGPNPFER